MIRYFAGKVEYKNCSFNQRSRFHWENREDYCQRYSFELNSEIC